MNKLVFYLLIVVLAVGCSHSTNDNATKPDISEAQNAFCYLKAAPTQMYAQPDKKSNQLWQFSKGEVLSVLDSKFVNETAWLRVKFIGNVKAGYEEMLQITERPTYEIGWIQGTVENLVSCR